MMNTSDKKHRDPSDEGTVPTPDLEFTERGGEGKFRDPASTFFNTVGGAPTEDSVAATEEVGVFVGATTVNTTSTDRASTTDRYHTSQPAGRVPAEDGISGTGDGGSVDISRGSDEELGLAESGEGESALSTVWRALRTVDAVSFSLTVVLSGIGSGFIDTFLFIRYLVYITICGTKILFAASADAGYV